MAQNGIKVTNLPEFQATLRKYVQLNRRDRVTLCNTKAYRIAKGAFANTEKASRAAIKAKFADTDVKAIMGKIINKQRGERGEKGLYGKAMKQAQKILLGQRLRAIAFLKSGWIPALKRLFPLAERVGRPRIDAQSRSIKNPKGSVSPATGVFVTRATIRNEAESRHSTTHDPLGKFGLPPLEKAVADETANMEKYIERKMRETANKLGIKTN